MGINHHRRSPLSGLTHSTALLTWGWRDCGELREEEKVDPGVQVSATCPHTQHRLPTRASQRPSSHSRQG